MILKFYLYILLKIAGNNNAGCIKKKLHSSQHAGFQFNCYQCIKSALCHIYCFCIYSIWDYSSALGTHPKIFWESSEAKPNNTFRTVGFQCTCLITTEPAVLWNQTALFLWSEELWFFLMHCLARSTLLIYLMANHLISLFLNHIFSIFSFQLSLLFSERRYNKW